ncbi:Crp/Fnr family transcriptional regulator [Ottowia sp. GY511]|uniref:Crp/Fnr family transcriptional regulator n=1 Tax=Ottowia flava TaxID=2675430 RepID=A0ABW4KPM2_9BURK|nr:Crp/Fnr family transcriptional regulator [Ottowia sp. GY511]TXK32827.1 Crp/Fnr family transcriptional regulator [Ottowia sp. GY511]
MSIFPRPQPPAACADCRLRQTQGFQPVTEEELACIQAFRSGTRKVAAGRAVIAELGDPVNLFTLYAGWAFRYKTLSDGRRQILNFLLPGDFIGLQAEFANTATHGVEALTDAQLCVFPQSGLWDFVRRNPKLGYDITWLSASGEQVVDENLVTVGQRNAAERIATLLIRLARRAERAGLVDGDGAFEFPLTQQHIADALGLSLVHTNKTLRKLTQLGLHEIRDGRLRIVKPGALAALADYAARPLRPQPLI